MNLEAVRDRTSSGIYFFCSLLLMFVTLASAWTSFSYKLRPPSTDLLGAANASFPPGWGLSISPHELSDYLLCAVAFVNFICSFFSDRRMPKLDSANDLLCVASLPKAVGDCHGQDVLIMGDDKFTPSSDTEKESLSDITETPQHICPEKYVSFPSRITFFWFTQLIVKGYRKTLQMSDLWALEDKHISASLGPRFYARITKYLRVSVSGVMDSPSVSSPQFSDNPPSLDPATSLHSDVQKSSGKPLSQANDAANSTNPSTGRHTPGRRSTFAEVSAFGKSRNRPEDLRSRRRDSFGGVGIEEEDEESEEWVEEDSSKQRRYRTMSEAPDLGKKPHTSTSASFLPNYQICFSGPFGRPKPQTKTSISGDLESGLFAGRSSDSVNKSPVSGQEEVLEKSKRQRRNKPKGGLVKSLFVTFGWPMFIAAIFKLVHDLCLLSGPIILKYLLAFLEPGSMEPHWHGYAYACILFVTAFIQSIALHQYFRTQTVIGMDIRTVLISAVYRKSLRLSAAARCESTTGEITNLMSIDSQRFCALMLNIHALWSAPFQVTVALYLLWRELGPSVLAGVGVLLIMIPVNTFVAEKSKGLQEKQLKTTDSRIKLISEILNGIRVLKLYAWEPSFIREVDSIRNKELSYLRKSLYLDCSIIFVFVCAPTLVALATFVVYILSSPGNVFNAEKAFVSLSLLNILRFPLFMFPTILSSLVQAYVSVRRLTKFLLNPELDPSSVSHEETPGVAAVIENGTLSWAPDVEPAIQNITVYFAEGQSTAIVGRVGSGKSSLLNALLGNMELISGRVNIKGSLALVSQQAWIFNGTLRDNILFHKPYNAERYAKIIKACALEPDIKLLSDGDLTDIGDKGVNLSGGQKQRISLARACYADADVYLFDDPLAAVDAHVANHLLTHVIGRRGLLASKTRIIATHHPNAIAEADRVALLEGGRLVEYGTYTKLTAMKNSQLNIFLRSKELRKRLLSEQVDSDQVPSRSLERSLSSLRTRTPSESYQTPHDAIPGDFAEPFLQEDQGRHAEHEQDDTASVHSRPDSPKFDTIRLRSSSVKEAKRSDAKVDVSYKLVEGGQDQSGNKPKKTLEETSATGRVKFSVFWIYIRSIGLGIFLAGVFFLLLNQLAWLGSNIWLAEWSGDSARNKNLTDSANATGTMDSQTYRDLVARMNSLRDLRLGIYGLIGLAQVVFNLFACVLLAIGGVHAAKLLHHGLLECIMHVPISFFDSTPQGRIMNRFSNDFATADSQLMRSLRSMITNSFICLITFALCAVPSAYILIPLVFLLAFYCVMQNLFVTTSRQLKRLDSVSKSPIFSHFAETLLGVDTIRAYRQCSLFVKTSDDRVDTNNRAYFSTLVANRWLSMILETVGNLLTLSVSIAFVATRDVLAAGFAGLVISYALNVTQSLSWLVRMSTEFETDIVSVERIKEYSELPIEAPWEVDEKKPPPQWPEGSLEFVNYSTRYREDLDLVLKSISFKINPGEKIGIVGRTGSGKSSLVLALFRVIEATEGEILIDGINIAKIGLHDLRGRLTLIPQDPVLFSGTLRFNLDPFNTYSDETVWEALTLANLRSFVENMSGGEGLDMVISEGGGNLSQGQRQLVCLARALLRRSKVLVLDEATAAVDPRTDQLIQQTVRNEFATSTVLTIAHRLDTILDYDRIMVLDAGRLVEMGQPQELEARIGSVFRGMLKEANLLGAVPKKSK
uniref:ABC-type glutathione-S-conjugate transporter n=1 Tax=Mesocestoides corti TaxID=53468 RepID=A0A5K3EWX4_MESCO